MRQFLCASAVVVLVGGTATYAVVGKSRSLGQRAEVKASAVETPRVETARLFAAPPDVSRASASDPIASLLAPKASAVVWPDAPKPAAKHKTLAKKPKQAQKPKPKQSAKKQAASVRTSP